MFGSWRRKGVEVGDKQYASPNAYGVAGFNFATMYNFGYKFRAGLSLDGVYDGSANVYTEDYIVEVGGRDPGYTFYTPPQRRDYLELETRFEEQVRLQLTAGRVLCEQQGDGAREGLIWSTLDQFEKTYVR